MGAVMSRFDSILVANRGEIAVRVIRSVQALGYRALAVYSEADANAPHVRMADDATCIGPAPVAESYLSIDRILAAARELGAGAIHPGYGFLSESAAFAEACEAAGLVFIGPTPEAIRLMGNKAEAKRRMIEAGVPCVPGYEGADQSPAAFLAAAHEIGFPIMVKAAAGGGGRGMRLVTNEETFARALAAAASEAQNAFGSGELILEKAIVSPRHVEIQVFADASGQTIHLGERDCSVQRRHQKVVEEAPCPVLTPDLREAMGQAAVQAAQAIGYRGAGTVEFLLDDSGAFYFLEMNTRLQVEHPVTEMVTGLDLVALQLQVAEGLPLPLSQEDVRLDGHAIEVRLYAEDPARKFLPRTGLVSLWAPAAREGVRYDSGVETGQEISPFYDPMIAKVIAWGPTREVARRRLIGALKETLLFGVTTNKRFLIDILEKDAFAEGRATTAFIDAEFSSAQLAPPAATVEGAAIAAVLLYRIERDRAHAASIGVPRDLLDWSSGGPLGTRYLLEDGETSADLLVLPQRDGSYLVVGEDSETRIDGLEADAPRARLTVNGARQSVGFLHEAPGGLSLSVDGHVHRFTNRIAEAAITEDGAGSGQITAPMPGLVLSVVVKEGDIVQRGDVVAVIEAMKMQHEINADVAGTVARVAAATGEQVSASQVLVTIEGGAP